jgi:hypothetical protein
VVTGAGQRDEQQTPFACLGFGQLRVEKQVTFRAAPGLVGDLLAQDAELPRAIHPAIAAKPAGCVERARGGVRGTTEAMAVIGQFVWVAHVTECMI